MWQCYRLSYLNWELRIQPSSLQCSSMCSVIRPPVLQPGHAPASSASSLSSQIHTWFSADVKLVRSWSSDSLAWKFRGKFPILFNSSHATVGIFFHKIIQGTCIIVILSSKIQKNFYWPFKIIDEFIFLLHNTFMMHSMVVSFFAHLHIRIFGFP